MQVWILLYDIVLLLGAALALGILFERLKQRAIVGYLLTGVLLGPAGFRLVKPDDGVSGIAELGVALLLFTIGLEFSWSRLRQLGNVAVGGGTLQVLLTMALFGAVGLALELSVQEAVIAGGAMALSSTAVVLRVLVNRAEIDTGHGRNSLGILLLQDIAVLPLVLVVDSLAGSGGDNPLAAFFLSLGEAALFVVALVLVSRYILPRLLHLASSYRSRDLPVLMAVTVFLLATWSAHAIEVSPILGAFLAGMLLASTPFAEQIRADVVPLRAAFVTVFFASIGMLLERPEPEAFGWAVLLAAVVIVGKTLVVALIVRVFRRRTPEAIATGLTLAQMGEFSFVLAELANKAGLVSANTFQVLLTSSLLTLVATPYLIAGAQRIALRGRGKGAADVVVDERADRVIVVGFGPAGRSVVSALEKEDLPFVVLELNPSTVEAYRAEFPISLGNASQPEILEHAGLPQAKALVVTIPDPDAVRLITRQAKRVAPEVPVIVRARQHHRIPDLLEAGADEVADEEANTGEAIARKLLSRLTAPPPE